MAWNAKRSFGPPSEGRTTEAYLGDPSVDYSPARQKHRGHLPPSSDHNQWRGMRSGPLGHRPKEERLRLIWAIRRLIIAPHVRSTAAIYLHPQIITNGVECEAVLWATVRRKND